MKIYRSLVFVLLASSIIFAQKSVSPVEVEKLFQDEMLNKLSSEKLTQNSFPLGNPIDPDYYKVGPGDKLVLLNITASTNEEVIEITPENLALIPRIGMVNTKGLTLSQTKELISKEIMKRNPNALPTVSLKQSRNVMVTIEGDFQFPGTYTLPASYNIETSLKMITTNATNNMLSIATFSLAHAEKQKNLLNDYKVYSDAGIPTINKSNYRNILILHNDGTSSLADLEYSFAFQDVKSNPYLKEGDRIRILSSSNSEKISISGSIFNPTTIQFKKGDKASLLLKLSGGLLPDVSLDDVLIYQNGSQIKYSDDIELSAGANIVAKIKETKSSNKSGIVSITGNVQNPGIYPIDESSNKVKDLVKLAGGTTKDAYFPTAYITRKDAKFDNDLNSFDNKYYSELFQYSDLTLEDSVRFKNDILNRKPNVSCDFVALYEKNDESQNIKLEDGDIIVFPSKPTGVYVFGQVNNPGFVTFKEKKNIKWYLDQVGGIAKGGKEGRARVIKAKTKVWIDADDEYLVEAGDYVYVPRSPDNPPGTDIQTYNLIITSIFALVSVLNFIVPFVR